MACAPYGRSRWSSPCLRGTALPSGPHGTTGVHPLCVYTCWVCSRFTAPTARTALWVAYPRVCDLARPGSGLLNCNAAFLTRQRPSLRRSVRTAPREQRERAPAPLSPTPVRHVEAAEP